MGIDYQAELIIGFELDTEKVEKWMNEYGIEDPHDINYLLKEKFPKIPKKVPIVGGHRSSSWSIYIVRYGDSDSENQYFLTFYEGGSFKIKDIAVTQELLDLAKEVYKEIIGEKLDCPTVSDVPIFPTLYVW